MALTLNINPASFVMAQKTSESLRFVEVPTRNPITILLTCIATFCRHIADVILGALVIMKEPASSLLALVCTLAFLFASTSLVFDTARTAVFSYQVCDWPLVSLLPICPVQGTHGTTATSLFDFPRLMSIQHRALDDVLGHSSAGTGLALNLKHAELAVQDLIGLVKGSNLTVKEVLSETLSDFVLDAKGAARSLQLFSAKVHGTVDSISAFNTYSMGELEIAQRNGKRTAMDAALARTFQASMAAFSSQISRLLVEASTTSTSLDRLEEHLGTAHALCVQEAFTTTIAQDELLWRLWTIIGGNKDQVRDLENREEILKQVQQYRSVAAAYIAAATHALSAVDADLTELRERMTSSDMRAAGIPIEVHISSLERGLYRLREEKLKGKVGHAGPGLPRGDHPKYVETVERSQVQAI